MYGARLSAGLNCWAAAGKVKSANRGRLETRGTARISSRGGVRSLPAQLQFYYMGHDVAPGGTQVAWTADRVLEPFQLLYGVANRIAPRVRLGVQVVIHVKDRIAHLA